MDEVLREQAYLKAKKKKKRFDEMVSENQNQSQTNGEGKQDRKLFPMSGKYEFKPAAHSLCRKKIWERRSWKKATQQGFALKIGVRRASHHFTEQDSATKRNHNE